MFIIGGVFQGGSLDGIYLDHAATTPTRPEVLDAMAPFFKEQFGNPSSLHRWGREARAALEEARERLAHALGASRREIVFTAGGTEADNLAVLGRWRRASAVSGGAGSAPLIACSAVEHKAVLNAARAAEREGARLNVLPVDSDGIVDLDAVRQVLEDGAVLVSVMWANNEVGTIQPVAEIAELCRESGTTFHTDAVQAFGHVPVRVDEVPCDLLAISAHKFGGPRGVGLLFVRDGVELDPVLHGGSHERGLRPGTHNVAGVVGMAAAAELAIREMETEARRLASLRDELQAGLVAAVPNARVHAVGAPRLPHILNVSFPETDQEVLLVALDLEGIAVSSGSACQSGSVEPSHVLMAMGQAGPREASVRFSLGRTTTSEHVRRVIERIPEIVERCRLTPQGTAA